MCHPGLDTSGATLRAIWPEPTNTVRIFGVTALKQGTVGTHDTVGQDLWGTGISAKISNTRLGQFWAEAYSLPYSACLLPRRTRASPY